MTVTVLPVNAMALQPMATSRIATNPHTGTVTTFDSRQLAELKASGDQQQAIQTVAEQFESLFLQMVLKQMRKASEASMPMMTTLCLAAVSTKPTRSFSMAKSPLKCRKASLVWRKSLSVNSVVKKGLRMPATRSL